MTEIVHHLKKPHYLVCVNKESYSEVAVKFAVYLAHRNKGYVSILHVIEVTDFQTLGSIANKMRKEMHENAQKVLNRMGEICHETGEMIPTIILREGLIASEILNVVENDNTFSMLLVGASPESTIKSKILPPLVSESGKRLQVPVLVVPGNLTEAQMAQLT